MGIIYQTYSALDLFDYIPEFNEDGSEKHIYCDGARFHVLWYTTAGVRCSCSNCEVNRVDKSESNERDEA